MFLYFPNFLQRKLESIDLSCLYEIRLRIGQTIKVNLNNQYLELSEECVVDKKFLDDVIMRACNYSIFTVEDSIKKGFITTDEGERIGLCGQAVYENDRIINIKNITSLNIRIPHQIIGCAEKMFNYNIKNKNVLIISPPGYGKTTVLRDFVRIASNTLSLNTLLCDEKNEIACLTDSGFKNDVGKNTDVITFADKAFCLECGIRNMKPNLIAMDELFGENDVSALIKACSMGINTVATVHAKNIEDLKNNVWFFPLLKNKIFDYYFLLSSNDLGKIEKVYQSDGIKLC